MTMTEFYSLHVDALAERLITDIRHRGLGVGDRYLTTDEIRQMLGVRKAVASKAVRRLADKGILIPRQRAGTFVGPGLGDRYRSKARTLHVLLPAGDPSGSHWAYQEFITGIRRSIPIVNVQFAFIPEGNPMPYVRELIEDQRATAQFLGVVAVSCAPEVYRFLSERRVPTVVSGSLYSSKLRLSSIDEDSHQSGRLLAQYLIDKGHRRIALLLTSAGRPGDNIFLDGVNDALSAAELAPNTLIQRSVRNDIEALGAMAKELFEEPDHPTAAITRGNFQLAAVVEAASSAGLHVPNDLEIVLDHNGQTTSSIDISLYPRTLATMSFPEYSAMIGKMLLEASENVNAEPQQKIIPMKFHEPEQAMTLTKGSA